MLIFNEQKPCTRIISSIYVAFFFTLFKGFKCNKLHEITLKKRFLLEPEKTNFKILKFSQNEILLMTILDHFTSVFSIPVKFEIYFLGSLCTDVPIFSGGGRGDVCTQAIYLGSCKKLSLLLLQISNYIYSP